MSRENVDVVRQGYERFAATGQIDPDIASPDFVWDMSNFHGWPEQQTYQGERGAGLPQRLGERMGRVEA